MKLIDPIEKMGFEHDGKKFMFIPSAPYMTGEEKKLVTGVAMINMDSGDIVAEIDIPMIELMKEDNYIIIAKYRKKLIDQYKKSKK